jgi:membrane fusion protein, multidrug efflux system
MNYKQIVSIVISTILISCGSGDKKSQLEKLIKQRDELNSKIATLQKEVSPGKNDSLVKKKMVGVISIKPQSFQHMVEIQGRVDADENISLSAKVPGTITDIFVKAGDEVRVGKSLAEIDNQQIISGIEEVRTQLAFATNVYEKQKNLWDKKIGTELQIFQQRTIKKRLKKSCTP